MQQQSVEYYIALPYPVITVQRGIDYVSSIPLLGLERTGRTADESINNCLSAKRNAIVAMLRDKKTILLPNQFSISQDMQLKAALQSIKLDILHAAEERGIVEIEQGDGSVYQLTLGLIDALRDKKMSKKQKKERARKKATANNIE